MATEYHSVSGANASFRGVLVVARHQAQTFSEACYQLVNTGPADVISGWGGAVELMLLAAVRSGIPIGAHDVRGLFCARVATEEDVIVAAERLHAVDERAALLKAAVKPHDDLFATFGVSPFSPQVVRWAARWRLTPTQVTWFSVVLAVGAALAFALGDREFRIAGAILLYLSFVLDCVDGQLARFTGRFSSYGGWLDAISDRVKEYIVYAGLAIGAAHTGTADVWPIALAAIALQTARHMTDTWYGAIQDEHIDRRTRAPLDVSADGFAATPQPPGRSFSLRLGSALGYLSARAHDNRQSVLYWVKRTLPFPIGERWLLIGVTAAVFDARITFVCLLSGAAIAAIYTLTGRILRARIIRASALGRHGTFLHRDSGAVDRFLGWIGQGRLRPLPIALIAALPTVALLSLDSLGLAARQLTATDDRLIVTAGLILLGAGLGAGHPHNGPLDWLVPAALRGAEYLFILLVARNEGVSPLLAFALIGAVTVFHYDLAARHDTRSSPLPVRRIGFGWDVRVLFMTLAAGLGAGTLLFASLLSYLSVVFIVAALFGVYRSRRDLIGPVPPRQHIRHNETEAAIVER
ncbi:MAG: DUF5941 domain-containing protein [Micromonosporaceae bacterium]